MGVAVFAVSGALAAGRKRFDRLGVTGTAGGLLRDVLRAEVPLLLRQTDLYATAAIAGATVYLALQGVGCEATHAALVGMAAVAGLRLAAILWRLRLPVFHVPEENEKL